MFVNSRTSCYNLLETLTKTSMKIKKLLNNNILAELTKQTKSNIITTLDNVFFAESDKRAKTKIYKDKDGAVKLGVVYFLKVLKGDDESLIKPNDVIGVKQHAWFDCEDYLFVDKKDILFLIR